MSLSNMLNLIEELVYRQSVRKEFFSCPDKQAEERYGLTPTELHMVRNRDADEYHTSLTFTPQALESCFPHSIASLNNISANMDDMVNAIFDQAEDGRNRVLHIAEYLWHKAMKANAPDWLFHIILWEVALISPPGQRDYAQLQANPTSARLIYTPWDIKGWIDQNHDDKQLTTPCQLEEPAYYIIAPDQFARNAHYARIYELSECIFLAFESFVREGGTPDDTDSLRNQYNSFCYEENLYIIDSVRLTDRMFWI
ncbi:MAG: hypothetical protein ACN4GR_06040 [Arenicellales bacterium]